MSNFMHIKHLITQLISQYLKVAKRKRLASINDLFVIKAGSQNFVRNLEQYRIGIYYVN